jgi:hypothetical protein
MEIAAIVIGIFFSFLIFITLWISDKKGEDFNMGISMGFVLFFLFIVETCLVANIIKDPQPTAIDVYQGKTTLEYTIRDGIKIDSVVVFKENNYGKEN